MIRKYWKIQVVILLAVLVLCGSYYYGVTRVTPQKERETYSVILYQHTDNEWAALTQGVHQAEEDFDLEVNYITMGSEDNGQDQVELIKRELKKNVDGILLAAADSEFLEKELKKISGINNLLTVETGAGDGYVKISGDDYKMGYELGKKIAEDIKEDEDTPAKEVLIVREYLERDSVALRYEGLTDALSDSKGDFTVKEVARGNGDFSLRLLIETRLVQSGIYVAALDKFCTEEAVAARESKQKRVEKSADGIKVYGIGNTAQIVSNLDSGRLEALVYQNEFNMGYEGIQAIRSKSQKGYNLSEYDIPYKLVTRDTLYEKENERLLFPSGV